MRGRATSSAPTSGSRARINPTSIPGAARQAAGPPTFGFEGFDFTASVSGNEASTFGDLFADVLHQRGARREDGDAERGADLHQAISVSFDEAIRGRQRA